jgi:hypothetical protein
MSKKSVLDLLEQLPPSARKEAEDFVRYLHDQYVISTPKKPTDSSIAESPFVGMWKDRKDLQDSTAWVREQRKRQWGHE